MFAFRKVCLKKKNFQNEENFAKNMDVSRFGCINWIGLLSPIDPISATKMALPIFDASLTARCAFYTKCDGVVRGKYEKFVKTKLWRKDDWVMDSNSQ